MKILTKKASSMIPIKSQRLRDNMSGISLAAGITVWMSVLITRDFLSGVTSTACFHGLIYPQCSRSFRSPRRIVLTYKVFRLPRSLLSTLLLYLANLVKWKPFQRITAFFIWIQPISNYLSSLCLLIRSTKNSFISFKAYSCKKGDKEIKHTIDCDRVLCYTTKLLT